MVPFARANPGAGSGERVMKVKTRHKKSHKWRKAADSSPVTKGRRPKKQGRNPHKRKHLGGKGL
jgi:hypothetical protein